MGGITVIMTPPLKQCELKLAEVKHLCGTPPVKNPWILLLQD